MRPTSIIVLLFGLTLSGAADAQMFAAPCHVNALCPGVARGGGRLMNCLRAHRAGLSQQCLAAIGRTVLDRASRGRDRMGSTRGEGPPGPYGGGGSNGGGPYGGPNGAGPYGGGPNGGGQNDGGGPNGGGGPDEDGGD
jgi:hypothetical protein